MDKAEKQKIRDRVTSILTAYDPAIPQEAANQLRDLWLQFEPKRMDAIKAELREQQETVGIPIPILKTIGKEVAKHGRKQVPFQLLKGDRHVVPEIARQHVVKHVNQQQQK